MFIILIFQVVLCSFIGGSPVPVAENRTHNAANEIQSSVSHDANGNMTVMPNLNCKYDAWNRLVEVNENIHYEYNGLNQRIKKSVGSTVTKSFFNKNWQELESVTGSQMTSYVWGLCYIDDLVLREKGDERLYSLADPNWNVVALVDATGAVVERMKYDAFGKITWLDGSFGVKTASDYGWNRTFTGQVIDAETGLMLYRNRYYHTELGRFVQRDPIGYEADDVNIYRYVLNQPTFFTDPEGNIIVRAVACAVCIGTSIWKGVNKICVCQDAETTGEYVYCMLGEVLDMSDFENLLWCVGGCRTINCAGNCIVNAGLGALLDVAQMASCLLCLGARGRVPNGRPTTNPPLRTSVPGKNPFPTPRPKPSFPTPSTPTPPIHTPL